MSRDLIRRYFAAFDAGDAAAMLELLSDDVRHLPNQGHPRLGKAAFAAFLAEMERAYVERTSDLVIFEGDAPGRFAAEFTILGTYRATQEGLPPATGQTYALPIGSFFEVADGRITRVSTHYNLQDWLVQVGA